jgi:hypothetical protein
MTKETIAYWSSQNRCKLSENIRLTKKQIHFITQMLEIEDPNKAADRFLELMALEGVAGSHIAMVIDLVVERMVKNGKL